MSSINSVGNDQGLAGLQQQLASSQAVGVQNIKPETRRNETIDAAPEVEHAQSQHQDEQYSHVRYIARNAFMTGSGSGTASLHSDSDSGGYISKKPETQASSSQQPSGTPGSTGADEASGASGTAQDDGSSRKTGSTTSSGEQLTDAEQEQVKELKDRDTEVRQHEQAHQSAGGQYASSPSYDYQTGPDGNRYAIGGHVDIDVSEESTPDKTIQKMQQVIQAAHAPADPSGQDLRVAAEAQQTLANAQAEKMEESSSSGDEGGDEAEGSGGSESQDAQAAQGSQDSQDAASTTSASGPTSTSGTTASDSSAKSSRQESGSSSDGSAAAASRNASGSKASVPQAPRSLSDGSSITGNDSSATANPEYVQF